MNFPLPTTFLEIETSLIVTLTAFDSTTSSYTATYPTHTETIHASEIHELINLRCWIRQ